MSYWTNILSRENLEAKITDSSPLIIDQIEFQKTGKVKGILRKSLGTRITRAMRGSGVRLEERFKHTRRKMRPYSFRKYFRSNLTGHMPNEYIEAMLGHISGLEQLTFQWLRHKRRCLFITPWVRWFDHKDLNGKAAFREIDVLALTPEKNYVIVSCQERVRPKEVGTIISNFKSYEKHVKRFCRLKREPTSIEKQLVCVYISNQTKSLLENARIKVVTTKKIITDLVQWLNSDETKGMETQDPLLWILRTLKESSMLKNGDESE